MINWFIFMFISDFPVYKQINGVLIIIIMVHNQIMIHGLLRFSMIVIYEVSINDGTSKLVVYNGKSYSRG